ncbi:MAG: hypothetical protein ACK58T_13595 [Phycisphaerae bacterium]
MRPGFAAGHKAPGVCNMRSGAVARMPGMIVRGAEFVEGLEAEAA